MSDLSKTLTTIRDEALAALDAVGEQSAAEDVRIRFISRNGSLTAAMKQMGTVPAEERPLVGKLANEIKNEIHAAIEAKLTELSKASSAAEAQAFDISLPGRSRIAGRKHPLSRITDECVEIFRRMGFVVKEGPDLEDEYHNFDALNTPADHPSRDSQDTFYMPDGRLLRTQTSPVQIRIMEGQAPPVRIIAPGRCFRRDTPDATHGMNFHQVEGLYVDKDVSMADLKGVLLEFAREMFGPKVRIRLRPHFFPFTEPSIECDVSWRGKDGEDGWLEVAGAGMVDPNVLRAVGYDPDEVSGFAFGLGIDRMAMIRYQIPDLRLLYDNDIRFLQQF